MNTLNLWWWGSLDFLAKCKVCVDYHNLEPSVSKTHMWWLILIINLMGFRVINQKQASWHNLCEAFYIRLKIRLARFTLTGEKWNHCMCWYLRLYRNKEIKLSTSIPLSASWQENQHGQLPQTAVTRPFPPWWTLWITTNSS